MRRRRRDAEQPCYPQLAADAWTLAVEDLLGARTPVRRNEVLRYAAGFLLVRRWVALRRPGTPRERRYARLPADVAQLAQASFPGSFVYAVGGGNAPEDTRIRHLLEVLKVNDEMWDFCTTRFDAALAQAVSVPDAERKAYVMARSCSRTAAALQCFSEPWDSVQHGITLVLAELRASAVEPRELFTQSFGPNRRHYNSCVGDRAAQEAYVRVAFDVALPPLEWTLPDPSGCGQALHASKAELCEQLLQWPQVGPLTAKNIFQLLRRAPLCRGFHAAATRRNLARERFGFTSAGARMCLNLLICEAGGRGFLRDAAGMGPMRHFSRLLVHFRGSILGQMRALAAGSSTLEPVLLSFEDQDETFWCFFLCELWKVFAYLATGDVRYELAYQDEL